MSRQYIYSNRRKQLFMDFNLPRKKESVCVFMVNWRQNLAYVRDHTRRSISPYTPMIKSYESDHFQIVEEHNSTLKCTSCFKTTAKQHVRYKGKSFRRVKGAAVCANAKCPRRISTRSTTSNRNQNSARNIALIGFSSLVSEDGLPLPPFRRGLYKSHK